MDLSVASAPPGATFNIVVHVIKREHGITTCEGLSPRQVFTVFGAPDDLDGKYTIYDLVRAQDEVHDCFFGKDTLAVAHPPKDQFARVTLMDLCSGMGGFSIGSQLIGMRTCAFVERSSLACAALRANFSCPVIQGELGASFMRSKVLTTCRSRVDSPVRVFPGKETCVAWMTTEAIACASF